jgi:iron(II)-dependent oxidoreductase
MDKVAMEWKEDVTPMSTPRQLAGWVRDARQRTFELVADLSDQQLIGPQLPTLNPLLWEIGHVAWFQEKWVLRRDASYKPILANADGLYDSAAIAHDTRWDLPLHDRDRTSRYLIQVRDRVLERLSQPGLSREDIYFTLLSVFHEDMHAEAFTYTRQTLAYPPPPRPTDSEDEAGDSGGEDRSGHRSPFVPRPSLSNEDAHIPGGTFRLGAGDNEPFVFDNEKCAHAVELRPFALSRTPVTQAEFAAFVDDGGYQDDRLWSDEGRSWRRETPALKPIYWERQGSGRWLRRDFDAWVPLEPDRPMLHVNWYEAEAYCRWCRRRLPLEAEWEAAAAASPDHAKRGLAPGKRAFPWGDDLPTPRRANLDGHHLGCMDVDMLSDGDSAWGCRQMIGNVWEWTASVFLPYPGFSADPYKEYSAPWFGTHKVLRGGCWATRSRLLRNTWRNFYRPERRDIFAGFRTCHLEP